MPEQIHFWFVPLQKVADAGIAECVRTDGSQARLTTADGRVYEGNVILIDPTRQTEDA